MNAVKKKSENSDISKQLWLNELGQKIKECRLKAGMSQADLAYSIRMDAQNISRIERGMVSPSAYAIKQICDTLNLPLSDFYSAMNNN